MPTMYEDVRILTKSEIQRRRKSEIKTMRAKLSFSEFAAWIQKRG
jgi:hypothetical protein